MVESVARVSTAQPARYLKQIVEHLGYRLTTRVTAEGAGVVVFDGGRCVLRSEPAALVLAAYARDAEALSHVREVVTRHLERFGGREGLTVSWSDASSAG